MTKLDQGVGNRTHIVFRSGMVVLNNDSLHTDVLKKG